MALVQVGFLGRDNWGHGERKEEALGLQELSGNIWPLGPDTCREQLFCDQASVTG